MVLIENHGLVLVFHIVYCSYVFVFLLLPLYFIIVFCVFVFYYLFCILTIMFSSNYSTLRLLFNFPFYI